MTKARYSWAGTVPTVEQSPETKGYYLAHEVGWLAGVSGDRIGQWARRGYIRSSVSTGRPRVYSFQDVGEAMVVHELLNEGVPLRAIKETIGTLRQRYGAWPLSEAPIASASLVSDRSRDAAVVLAEGDTLTALHGKPGHGVLDVAKLRRIADELRRGGWAARDLPDLRWIEVDPDRLSGRPTIRGTRVPAEVVARLAETVDGLETLRADYGVHDRQIRDAKRWWQRIESYAQAA